MKFDYSYIGNVTPAYLDDLYAKFQSDPDSIDAQWRAFFEGVRFSAQYPEVSTKSANNKEIAVTKLIQGFRARGHLISKTNPIRERRKHQADLELNYFGLSDADLSTEFEAGNDLKLGKASLQKILDRLHKTYCSSIGVEFTYCRNEKLRQWLYNRMEPIENNPEISVSEKHHILYKINEAVTFENFLQTKYVGKKRFSLEGLEAFIPSLDAAIRQGSKMGVKECIMGMAHRGRLNVLVNVFEKSYEEVFAEFEDNAVNSDFERGGDVKYHLGRSSDITTPEGSPMHLCLLPNPSHLEAVGPVLQGVTYAKKDAIYNGDINAILPIIVHGDAAISGQGVNYESANMSKIAGYEVGGSLHIVLNNQVGFTANYKEGRSSVYCTDLAKVTESPVFHVNADDPVAVVHAMTMAVEIRQLFNIDVYVDILGYRRYGHNEGDEPRFTQPVLYKAIAQHQNIYQVYLDRLVQEDVITVEEAGKHQDEFKSELQAKLDKVKVENGRIAPPKINKRIWHLYRRSDEKDFDASIETGVAQATLDKIAKAICTEPEKVALFSKMAKLLQQRNTLYANKTVDWAMAELLAYGSLLVEGHPVRISGQDSQRGTFSHRHAVIRDENTEEEYVPLNNIQEKQAALEVYNSFLSEYGVLAFEYGYSTAVPANLAIWEAQFGDFSNGAQIVIDQFISSAESKWHHMSGLVMYLPHGYEGQGPEHSSARLERYLQLCSENNMYVCNVTTPANLFHLLRRQIHNEFRKPLILMTPKSLLRHPEVISPVSELTKGGFQELIDDAEINPKSPTRVVLCSGKLYYDLLAYRRTLKSSSVALVRLEQLYPLPMKQLAVLKKRYAHVKDWVWAQEEPENMGAWSHLLRHLRSWNLEVKSRLDSASPATGSQSYHNRAQEALVKSVFAS